VQALTEYPGVDARRFHEDIEPRGEPAVLRGIARDWPAVQAARQSPGAVCRYIMGFDRGFPVDALLMPPEVEGRIFYSGDMRGFNYARKKVPLSTVVEQVARYSHFPNAPAVAAQSALVHECLPGFERENVLALLDAAIPPRIWLGNRVTTPAHFDQSSNIACVVAGRRRFTLFAPGQVDNLYIGPLDFAPTPTPISLVDFKAPDFERFPRFREALANARVAELDPGDAIYMPPLWWHHVESLSGLNILVNYWWGAAADAPKQAFEKLLAGLRERA
jgi:oxalate decarboxylase/phosphoglucose isomerase-like protein (cupin superfamily)